MSEILTHTSLWNHVFIHCLSVQCTLYNYIAWIELSKNFKAKMVPWYALHIMQFLLYSVWQHISTNGYINYCRIQNWIWLIFDHWTYIRIYLSKALKHWIYQTLSISDNAIQCYFHNFRRHCFRCKRASKDKTSHAASYSCCFTNKNITNISMYIVYIYHRKMEQWPPFLKIKIVNDGWS